MIAYCISDLHLPPGDNEQTKRFQQFCRSAGTEAQRLLILGDLVEAWIGDDRGILDYEPVLSELRRLTERGVEVALLSGNHDFLYGESFQQATGTTLLPDPFLIADAGVRIAFSHGDALCTDDLDYQNLRRTLRSADWQSEFLAKTAEERYAFAGQLARQSAEATGAKKARTMDVNPGAVRELHRSLDYDVLIHGHTHLPGVHPTSYDGRNTHRIVLGSWQDDAELLRLTSGTPKLIKLDDLMVAA